MAVEAARIAAVAVVVDDRIDVGGLAPADSFEMDPERGFDRSAGDIERQRRRSDPEGAGLAGGGRVGPQPVGSAKVVRRLEMKFHVAGRIGGGPGGDARTPFPAPRRGGGVALAPPQAPPPRAYPRG